MCSCREYFYQQFPLYDDFHYYCNRCAIDFHATKRGDGSYDIVWVKDTLPLEKHEITNDSTYTECYWKFVNSQTDEDAKFWFNQMIAQVNLDLQPNSSLTSWVSEDPNTKARRRVYGLPGIVTFLALAFVMVILMVHGII